jgi:hypothetical protein
MPQATASNERRFFTGMTLAIGAAVFLGFARTFFLRPWFPEHAAVHAAPERFFYVHGAAFAAWIGLLILQAWLVAKRRVGLHRTLGWFGAALALVMLGLGVFGAILAARRPTGFVDVPVPAREFLLIPLTDVALFGLFVALAVAQRGNAQAHKRLMLLASINLTTAAISRWPFVMEQGPSVSFGLTDLFLVSMVVWDLVTRRRLHPVTLWGGLLFVASQPLRLVLSGSEAWIRIATWLIG